MTVARRAVGYAALALVALLALPGWRAGSAAWDYMAIRRAAETWEKQREVAAAKADAPAPPATPAPAEGAATPNPATSRPDPKAQRAERIAKWQAGGLFGPPPPQMPPPTLSAIIGNAAILNGQPMKVGDSAPDGSKIVEIHNNRVVLEKDGARNEIILFEALKPQPAK
jgi:hypothetical protein